MFLYIYLPKAEVDTTEESNLVINDDKLFMVRPEKGASEGVIGVSHN